MRDDDELASEFIHSIVWRAKCKLTQMRCEGVRYIDVHCNGLVGPPEHLDAHVRPQ